MSEISKLERFLANLEMQDYDAERAIARLSEIDNLNREASEAQNTRDRVRDELAQGQRRLSKLQNEINQAEASRDSLLEHNAKATSALLATQEQVKGNLHRIEFAEAVLLLFSNIEKIPPAVLIHLAWKLEMISRARFNPAAIYPIDYEGTRKEAVELLELALGKSVVPRETFDNLLKCVGEQHDDLMLDKLGKMRKEHDELETLKSAVGQLTLDKLIRTAIFQKCRGVLIRKYTCPGCRTTIVHSITDSRNLLTSCPFCKADLPLDYT